MSRQPKKIFGRDNPFYTEQHNAHTYQRRAKVKNERARICDSADQGGIPHYRWDWSNEQQMVIPGEAGRMPCRRCSDNIGALIEPGKGSLEPPQRMRITKHGVTLSAVVEAAGAKEREELAKKYHAVIKEISDGQCYAIWTLKYEERGRPQDYSVEYMANRARYEGIPEGVISGDMLKL